jgi:outer membrane receptor protein involved in Fe transport
VRQEVLNTFPTSGETTSNFTVVDAAIGYRFPRRRGLVSLEVRNLFDDSFSYQNLSFQTNEPLTPRFVPARTIFARLALFF